MTAVDLLLIFFVLPVFCAITIGYPILLVVGMLIDRRDTVELKRPWWIFWMIAVPLNSKLLLRPVSVANDNLRLLHPVTSSLESPKHLLQSSSFNEHSG